MPTHIYDCHQEWLCFELSQMRMAGFLSLAEARLIKLRVGTSELNFDLRRMIHYFLVCKQQNISPQFSPSSPHVILTACSF